MAENTKQEPAKSAMPVKAVGIIVGVLVLQWGSLVGLYMFMGRADASCGRVGGTRRRARGGGRGGGIGGRRASGSCGVRGKVSQHAHGPHLRV